jgi:hypothetical protein
MVIARPAGVLLGTGSEADSACGGSSGPAVSVPTSHEAALAVAQSVILGLSLPGEALTRTVTPEAVGAGEGVGEGEVLGLAEAVEVAAGPASQTRILYLAEVPAVILAVPATGFTLRQIVGSPGTWVAGPPGLAETPVPPDPGLADVVAFFLVVEEGFASEVAFFLVAVGLALLTGFVLAVAVGLGVAVGVLDGVAVAVGVAVGVAASGLAASTWVFAAEFPDDDGAAAGTTAHEEAGAAAAGLLMPEPAYIRLMMLTAATDTPANAVVEAPGTDARKVMTSLSWSRPRRLSGGHWPLRSCHARPERGMAGHLLGCALVTGTSSAVTLAYRLRTAGSIPRLFHSTPWTARMVPIG